MKLSDMYSSLFVIRFSVIFQKNFGGGKKTEKSPNMVQSMIGLESYMIQSMISLES